MDRSDYDNELLAAMRRTTGLTQEQVAAQVGVKRVTIARVESGVNASYDILKRITGLYGKPITSVLRIHDPATV